MIDAAIIGLGWWGKNIVNAVQAKSERLRFVRGVSKEPDTVRDFAAHHNFELSTDLNDALTDPREFLFEPGPFDYLDFRRVGHLTHCFGPAFGL